MKIRRRRRTHHGLTAAASRIRMGVAVFLLVLVSSTVAYLLLGLGLLDAIYQTVITVSTVGYREVGEVDGSFQIVTVFVVLFGTGSVLYTTGVVVEGLVEGTLNNEVRHLRMQRRIDELNDHVVIAGWGRVGHSIADYARRAGSTVVVIDREENRLVDSDLVVSGEATDDDVLRLAGIERAAILIAALDGDADNLYVTLSARALNPNLFIVARTSSQANEPKFFRAGANRVVNPHEIGGSRMAALALQPHVAEFLDEVLHDDGHDVTILEFEVTQGCHVAGRNVGQLIADADGAVPLAIRRSSGGYTATPQHDEGIDSGDVLIVIGSTEALERVRVLVA